MLGFTIVREKDLPFIREVHRLIEKNPKYLDGIRNGTVHLSKNPERKQREEQQKEGLES